jgi:hypothetical protein
MVRERITMTIASKGIPGAVCQETMMKSFQRFDARLHRNAQMEAIKQLRAHLKTLQSAIVWVENQLRQCNHLRGAIPTVRAVHQTRALSVFQNPRNLHSQSNSMRTVNR